MLVHMYGIIDSREIRCPGPAGHEADAVTAVPVDCLAAIVSEASSAAIDASVARVWHHEKVLSALMERHSVLPMRFGTICRRDELPFLLSQRMDALRKGLGAVGGKVEMAVRITQGGPSEGHEGRQGFCDRPAAETGRSYLLALAARRRRRQANSQAALRSVQEVKARVAQLSAQTVWQEPETPGDPFKASCLIARDRIEAFVSSVGKLERPDLPLSCTGPWAPYSFVGKDAALRAGT